MKRRCHAPSSPRLVDRPTSPGEAMGLVSRLGREGREVWVPCDSLPVLGRARAPFHVDGEGRRFYRFPPPRDRDETASHGVVGRAVALLALLASSPLFLAIGASLFLARSLSGRARGTAAGVFFRQNRRGRGSSAFRIIKFRTLAEGRPLPMGRWLRSHGLDELPQLWNIVRGEMAWLGPRPLPVEDLLPPLPWIEERFTVLPGLTGLYQCCRDRRGLSVEEMAVLDLFWLRNRSPRLDARLLAATFASMAGGWGREGR